MSKETAFDISLVVIGTLLIFFLGKLASGQTLPDAPSTVCATSVSCDDGVKDEAGNFYKYGDMLTDCLDPKVKRVIVLTPGPCEKSAKVIQEPTPFFKFGRWNAEHSVRTTREVLTSKTFILMHSVELAATLADIEVTHQGIAHHKCHEANLDLPSQPSRGELYRYNLIPVVATTALDFLMDKFVWRPLSLIAPVYGTVVHTKGALAWVSGGCW